MIFLGRDKLFLHPAAPAALVCRGTIRIREHKGQERAYFYFENEPGRRSAAKLLTKDEARRIAVNIAKLRSYCAINARGGGGLGALKQKGRTERPLSFEEMEERPSHRP